MSEDTPTFPEATLAGPGTSRTDPDHEFYIGPSPETIVKLLDHPDVRAKVVGIVAESARVA